jgi:hypothetical protein
MRGGWVLVVGSKMGLAIGCRCGQEPGFNGAERGRGDAVGGERWSRGGGDGDRPPQGSLVGVGARARDRGGRKVMDASLHRSEVVQAGSETKPTTWPDRVANTPRRTCGLPMTDPPISD